MTSVKPDTILTNARVLTMSPTRPLAEAVAIARDRIVWVGTSDDAESFLRSGTTVVDCAGGTLLPGFHDAHIHLLAYASALAGVDCGPDAVSSIDDLKSAIRRRASNTSVGEWIRASGYDETALAEARHPTRWDLDDAAPDHPVRLDHRSGHGCVLNSDAMTRIGIGDSTDEPKGATIVRDLRSGQPSGLLLEMSDYLDGRIPSPPVGEIEDGVRRASRMLLSHGVTSIQDATHRNSMQRWELFGKLRSSIGDMPRVTMMPGFQHLDEFTGSGLNFGCGDSLLRVGHCKLMVSASSGRQTPLHDELCRVVSSCAESGFPVAIHAVERETIISAAEAIQRANANAGTVMRHRIEHCSEGTPDAVESVVRSSAWVVTQPGFVHHSGDRYLKTVEPSMSPHLYPVGALARAGVRLAFGSDAPVSNPNPMPALRAAVTRLTAQGRTLGLEHSVDLTDALAAYTVGSAASSCLEDSLGKIMPGMLADLALFGEDILSVSPSELHTLRPVMTILGGKAVTTR